MVPKIGVITNRGGWYCYYSEDTHVNELEPTMKTGQKYDKKEPTTANQHPPGHSELFFEGASEDEIPNSDFDVSSDCNSVISTAPQVEKAQYSEDGPADDLNFRLTSQNEDDNADGDAPADDDASALPKKVHYCTNSD